MKIEIKENILKEIGKIADANGINAYVVGGYVRDYFLNRPRTDFDITVEGDSISFAKKVAAYYNSKCVIYERFRTAMVPLNKLTVEFVGTRKEVYEEGSRNPIVTEGTLEDDIRRRDFTVNTLLAKLNSENIGDIIDIFNGFEDLQNKVLKTPLNPETTYSDDPLRMIRAVRFSSQLNFRIEKQSIEAISKLSNKIKIVSQERITDEFLKIMSTKRPSIGLRGLEKTGLLKYIFPEIHNLQGVDKVEQSGKVFAHKDVFKHTLQVVDNISKVTENVWLRFAALMHDIAKPVTKRYSKENGWTFHGHEELGARWQKKIFKRMKFPLDKLNYVETLVRLHQRPMMLVDQETTDSAFRRLAVQAGEYLEDLFILCRADITTKNFKKEIKYLENYDEVFKKIMEVQEKDKLREFQSPVDGKEIMDICEIKPSKTVGLIKNEIEEAILEGDIPNEYEAAKEYFLKHKEEWVKRFS